MQHGNGVGSVQLSAGGFDGLEQIAVVVAVDEVADDFGVRLAGKHIALGLQLFAQRLVVFDDAVVHQRHAGGLATVDVGPWAVAEMRMRVAHLGRAVRGPARVGNARQPLQIVLLHLRQQLGHARSTACALNTLADGGTGHHAVHRHPAGVVTPVLQALQALHQQGNDVAGRNRSDDATHKPNPSVLNLDAGNAKATGKKFLFDFEEF